MGRIKGTVKKKRANGSKYNLCGATVRFKAVVLKNTVQWGTAIHEMMLRILKK